MRILVTGSEGYIGKHTLDKLGGDHELLLIDSHFAFSPKIEPSKMSLHTDFASEVSMTAIGAFQPECVIHLAALKNVAESMQQPHKYMENNYRKTEHLLEKCVEVGVEKFIFASSAAVYGSIDPRTLIHEDAVIAPVSPYGESKAKAEEAIEKASFASGMKFYNLRFFNVAGGSHSDLQGSNLFPIIARALSERRPIRIFGSNFDTTDGTALRDYVHVDDVTEVIVTCAASDDLDSNTFNVARGKGVTVLEVVRAMERSSGQVARLTLELRREGEPSAIVANIERMYKFLNLSCDVNLDKMASDTWSWYLDWHTNERK